jgi:hypothetical protein
MPDLSTYEGRQEARDAGYWVGEEGGQVTSEYLGTVGGDASPGAPMIGGGYSGGGPAPTVQAQSSQLADGINSLLGAIASGNKAAFDEAVRQFNVTFGLDEKKFTEAVRQFNEGLQISQAGLTGTYGGQQTQQAQLQAANIAAQQAGLTGTYQAPGMGGPGQATLDLQRLYGGYGMPAAGQNTLEAQRQYAELYGGAGGMPGAGQETLAAQQQRYAQQMGMINQAASLQANPFRQQQALGQMGRLLGGQGVSGFQSPNTVAGVGTAGGNTQGGLGYLSQMIEDIRNPAANTASVNEVMNAIPTPTKLNSVEFLRAAPSTQSMVLQGMSEKYGLDPNDALRQIQATLPQFTSPTTTGTVKR